MPTLEPPTMPTIERNFNSLEATQEWIREVRPRMHPQKVRIILSDEDNTDPADVFLANLDELAVDTGITDLAEQHDHYLHGLPKHK